MENRESIALSIFWIRMENKINIYCVVKTIFIGEADFFFSSFFKIPILWPASHKCQAAGLLWVACLSVPQMCVGWASLTGFTGLWDSAREGGWGRTSVKKVEDNFSIIYEVVKKPLSWFLQWIVEYFRNNKDIFLISKKIPVLLIRKKKPKYFL